MKWLVLWLLVSTPSVFAEDFECFGGWSECDIGCWMPMETVTPAENTRIVIKAPVGAQVNLWGTQQPVQKGEVGGYKFYLNPCVVSTTKEIKVTIPVDGKNMTITDQVVIYPEKENVFGYFYDSFSARILRFQNHDRRLFTIFKVPEDAIMYINGTKRKNVGSLRTFSTDLAEGSVLKGSVITITVVRNGQLKKWEESFDLTVALEPYRFTIVYDEALGELIRREPVKNKEAPRVVKPRSKT